MTTFNSEFADYQARRQYFLWGAIALRPLGVMGAYYHQCLTQTYSHLVPSGAAVLEVGCAAGDLLQSFNLSLGVGVDFCSSVIFLAQERHPSFFHGDARNFEIPHQSFDYIIVY